MSQHFGTNNPSVMVQPCCLENDHWIEIELVGEDDSPIAFEEYEVVLPDGSNRTGILNVNGFARLQGLAAGNHLVRFPRIDRDACESVSTLPAR